MSEHQLDLLYQFARARRLPELHCLDKGRFERVAEDVRSLNLEDIVSEGNQVSDSVTFHVCLRLQEGLHLPLLVVTRVHLLVLRPRGNNRHVSLQSLEHFRQEPMGGKFDPALGRIGHYVHFSKCLGLIQEIVCDVIELSKPLLEGRRELEVWLVDEVLMRRKERRAQDSVIPVKDNASLANLRFVLLP